MTKKIVAGIDMGSRTAKAVVFSENKILGHYIDFAGIDSAFESRRVLEKAVDIAKLPRDCISYIVSTGYGRIIVPFADHNVTEITCHARGAVWLFPNTRTVVDIGGQDCKSIKCDAAGRVQNFIMNEKCAAGTGRWLERVAETLQLPLEEIGSLSLQPVSKPATISSVCAIFTQIDILMLLGAGVHRNDILAGTLDSFSSRVWTLVERVGFEPDFLICGGGAKNIGFVKRLEAKAQAKARVPPEPQIIGALGAALIAQERVC